MTNRLDTLKKWLTTLPIGSVLTLNPASEDASFRRYFRITTETNNYVVMDAPPEKEPLDQFIKVNLALAEQGVKVPNIFHQDIKDGFLLLEDLGERTYLLELPDNPDKLYDDALNSLLQIQNGALHAPDVELPLYDYELFNKELDIFIDWYLNIHKDIHLKQQQIQTWQDSKKIIINACLEQPRVWVHRDFHSRNLMIVEQSSPAVIDFQDMVLGPLSYDLASLFKDCYIHWPREQQHKWLASYLEKYNGQSHIEEKIDLPQLVRWVDLTGLQRHLKVLGVFCRLNYRDNKPNYLSDLPLVKKYTKNVLGYYPELKPLQKLFKSLNII